MADIVKYQANSHKSKEEKEQKINEKIVSGKVQVKKRSEINKFLRMFFPDDSRDIKDIILMDIVIPATKKIISDAINIILYGDSAPKNNNTSRVSYTSYYNDSNRKNNSARRRFDNFDDIILESRGDVEKVLDRMEEYIRSYGMVSVSELYDLMGITSDYTTTRYGWTNLDSARIERVFEGYKLVLPKALPIS
jgi:hypothetical protein